MQPGSCRRAARPRRHGCAEAVPTSLKCSTARRAPRGQGVGRLWLPLRMRRAAQADPWHSVTFYLPCLRITPAGGAAANRRADLTVQWDPLGISRGVHSQTPHPPSRGRRGWRAPSQAARAAAAAPRRPRYLPTTTRPAAPASLCGPTCAPGTPPRPLPWRTDRGSSARLRLRPTCRPSLPAGLGEPADRERAGGWRAPSLRRPCYARQRRNHCRRRAGPCPAGNGGRGDAGPGGFPDLITLASHGGAPAAARRSFCDARSR